MLHVTSGDIVADTIRQSGVIRPAPVVAVPDRDPDEVIAWRDVLYEGPVRAGLSPVNLAHERAQYIAARGWEPYILARQALGRRDSAIASTRRQEEVTLWFEDDLHDGLQLIQILGLLTRNRPPATTYTWVLAPAAGQPGGTHGFAGLAPDDVPALLAGRRAIPDSAWVAGRAFWDAFISGDPAWLPEAIERLEPEEPILGNSARRLLAEFPGADDGLSASERGLLRAIADQPATPAEAFTAAQLQEPRPFLGDRQAWDRLDAFATAPRPLIAPADGSPWVSPRVDLLSPDDPDMTAFAAQRLTLTGEGAATLAGRRDWLSNGGTGRWLGGYRISDPEGSWRYAPATATLRRAAGTMAG